MKTKTPLKDLVKQGRVQAGLTQCELALKVGVLSKGYVPMVESGLRLADLGRLPAIAKTLRISLGNLVYRYIVESKSIPDAKAKADLIQILSPQKADWHKKLDALNPKYRSAVLESINTLYARQIKDAQPATHAAAAKSSDAIA